MTLMENGDLREYLKQHCPAKSIQLSWFREMACSLARIHDLRVIVADIATRNFLLAADLSIKFSDFTESTILPLDTDMRTADDAGFSVYTNIGQLGTVIYEVTKGAFLDAYELLAALNLITLNYSLENEKKIYQHLGFHDNVMRYVQISKGGIEFPPMKNRSLDEFLLQQKPGQTQQLNWIRDAAAAVIYAHSKRVFIANIVAQNFLIDDDQSLKLCNFHDARIIPEYLNMNEVGKQFEFSICEPFDSAQHDYDRGVAILEATSQEAVTKIKEQQQISRHEPFQCWPQDQELPNAAGMFIGDVIRNCWAKNGYQNMEDVCYALSRLPEQGLLAQVLNPIARQLCLNYSPLRFTFVLTITAVSSLAFPLLQSRPSVLGRGLHGISGPSLVKYWRRTQY
ncbi:MAG: hypothetical protein M1834_006009 [Cirrosporium novae-zelandiae]|nr:MAG: hypothetical protein M1834_006009 [Cirrosporium novae-zelandiae]